MRGTFLWSSFAFKHKKMNLLKIVLLLPLLAAVGNSHYPWSEKLSLKVDNCLETTFATTDYSLKKMPLSSYLEENTKLQMANNLYQIQGGSSVLGYIYVNQAPSMKNVFDYAVVFSPELKITNTKVLIYREQHGRQIGTKRWLQQFFDMDKNSRPQLGQEVDGITGATISASSMTKAVHDLLSDIDYLESQGFFSNE